MKVEIEKYRGFEISFDTEKETFTAWSNAYDNETKEKQSYAATKKYVDDFLKDNTKFKSFFVFKAPSHYNSFERKQIIGIRKDMRFVDANKEQISDYNTKDYLLWDESVTEKIAEYNRLSKIVEDAVKERSDYKAKAFGSYKTLKEYKEENFTSN